MLISAVAAASTSASLLPSAAGFTAAQNTAPTNATSSTASTTQTAATDTAATNTGTTTSTTAASTTTPSSGGGGGGGGGGVSVASSLAALLASYNFKVGDKNYVSSISSSNGEYTATVSGVGSVSGSSETAVENEIALKVSEMA